MDIAKIYYSETNARNQPYNIIDIQNVMEQTQTFINENSEIYSVNGFVKKIRDEYCSKLNGGREAKDNWIKFYAEKAGKLPDFENNAQSKRN